MKNFLIFVLVVVSASAETYIRSLCDGVIQNSCSTPFPTCYYNATCENYYFTNGKLTNKTENWDWLASATGSGVCRDSRGYAYDESSFQMGVVSGGKSLPQCIQLAYKYNAIAVMVSVSNWINNDYYFTCKLLFEKDAPFPVGNDQFSVRRGGTGGIKIITSHSSWACYAPEHSLYVEPVAQTSSPLPISHSSNNMISDEVSGEEDNPKKQLTTGEIIAVIVSTVCGSAIIGFGLVKIFKKYKKSKEENKVTIAVV
jgi:hypothetical protein